MSLIKHPLSSVDAYSRAATLGVVAGMRSIMPVALLSNRPAVRFATTLASLGELVGDKLPVIPSRIQIGPLGARVIIGGAAGAILCREGGKSPIVGAILGAAGAGAGTYAGFYARTSMKKATKLPDFVLGGAEDLIALGLGRYAVRNFR